MVSTTSDGRPFRRPRAQRPAAVVEDLGMTRLDYLLVVLGLVVGAALILWTLELGAILAAPVS